ncbi:SusC/RagA family TonB-linked outer membrane protein [Draconibacterium sediminis]|nr:SusC/RagA family TonB-linked outer membrane protein [Draconibacterium sediminis]
MIFTINLFAQGKSISGKVTDNNKEPLPGVTVVVKGTTDGTVTDWDGKFQLVCPQETKTLVFSYIGMLTKEVELKGQSEINVSMVADYVDVDEVVVVGYGTQKKRDVTGAITSVSSEAIEQRQAVNVFDALQGTAAGVQITSESGAPGASSTIMVRGASTFDDSGVAPLFVVDNVIVDDVDNINPNDIKSIEILKDAASSAIYGARSANGVVIITTKMGEAGTPRIDVRILNSYSFIANKLPQINKFQTVLNNNKKTQDLMKFKASTDSVGLVKSQNYFYEDLLTRVAIRKDVNLGISGGSDRLKYNASIGYNGNQGIILTSYNNKLTSRFNVDYQVSDKLKWMSRISFGNSQTNGVSTAGVLQGAIRRDPDMILYYPDGSFAPYYQMGGRKNPVQELYDRENLDERWQTSLYQAFEFKINKDLVFQTSATANLNLRRKNSFSSAELDSKGNRNKGSDNTTWSQIYQGDAYLSYNKKLNDHNISAMAGSSVETGKNEYLNYEASYFVSEAVHTMNLGTLDLTKTNTTATDYAIAGFFGRIGYNYKGRYMFNSNIRYDGSSRFGKNKRWGLFPSASLGWRFSDESFMGWAKNWLSDGKLRASWGRTGNDRVGYYESQLRYTSGSYAYNGISGVVPVSTYGNPNLHWEQTEQTDIGLDLNFLGGRASLTADYYVKTTTDLLSSMNLPYTTGYDNTRVNLASIENKGVEISLSGYPVRKKDFSWQTTVNWWKNDNTIVDLAREDYIQSNMYYVAKGYSAGLFYGYNNMGVYPYDVSNAYTEDNHTLLTPVLERDNNGNVIIGLDGQPTLLHYTLPNGDKYEGTINQLTSGGVVMRGGDVIWENMPNAEGVYDNKIDDNDRKIMGKGSPDWSASWSNNLNYKRFTFSFNFYVSWGGLIYNDLKQYLSKWGGNSHREWVDYIVTGWKFQGQNTPWYAIDTRNRKTKNRAVLSDFYLEDASFIRLRNVRLSYNFDEGILGKTFIKGATAYIYGNNLATWTNYTGFDPEVGGSVLTPGKDRGSYPRNREVGLGLNLNF